MRNCKMLLPSFIVCLLVNIALAQPGIWSNSVNVSNNSRSSRYPDICIDSLGQIHLVWGDNSPIGWGNSLCILYKYFDGINWSFPAVQISESAITEAVDPQIALDFQDHPHVVWADSYYYYSGYYATIKYSHNEYGEWSPPLNLSMNAHYNWRPNILFDSTGQIYVFWDGSYNGSHHILYRIYNGNQWGPILDATPSAGLAWDAQVERDAQDNLHIIYVQGEGSYMQLFYIRNEGMGWSQPTLVTSAVVSYPALCLDENGDPHAVWRQDIPYIGHEIFYSHCDDGVWTSPVNISQCGVGGHCYDSQILISSGVKYVSFIRSPNSANAFLGFVYAIDSVWSVYDTILVGLPNQVLDFSMASDDASHLQLVSSVPQGSISHDIIHIAYINSSLLPATLISNNPPITLPSTGGSFQFDASVANLAVLSASVDVWFDVRLPNGNIFGPLMVRQNINIAAGDTLGRSNMSQYVPASAPAGQYYYRLHAGDYPSTDVSCDSFVFTKLGSGVWELESGEWSLTGWDGEEQTTTEDFHPSSFILHPSHPNPFNPSTTFSYELQAASYVTLKVYDTAGRLITSLVESNQLPGQHAVTFDGRDLPSGLYLARLQAGTFTATQKLVLVK